MAVIEIQAKTMLAHIREPDDVFALKYNMNLYRGCQHQCIYCDSRSECYQIENFNQDVLVKINALALLENELPRKRVKGVIGTGSMNDPYMPLEAHYRLTRGALALIAQHQFGVHVITKSDLVVRDLDLLQAVGQVHAAVCFSISTTQDELSRKLEPGAPPVSRRFAAMQALAEGGVAVGACMMPVLPFLEDTSENIQAVVEQTVAHGGSFIVPWFGMSLRDRCLSYYYTQLDRHFPGLRAQYEKTFGDQYGCPARNAKQLSALFYTLCEKYHHAPGWMLVFPELFLRNFQGQLDWALDYYQRAIEQMPNAYQAYQGRADACRANGRLDWALLDYHQAIKLAPKEAELYLNRGKSYQQLGALAYAANDFRSAIQLAQRAHIRREAETRLNQLPGSTRVSGVGSTAEPGESAA